MRTQQAYQPTKRSLVDILRGRSEDQAERVAFTFTRGRDGEETQVTYEALDRRSRAIAELLQRETTAGERALLLYPPGLQYLTAFLGCLYSGVVAVPVYPPNIRQERSLDRLRSIVNDAAPTIVLTSEALLPIAGGLAAGDGLLATARWLATDGLGAVEATEWRNPVVVGDTLAFIQYTSGSTRTPKGVMVDHANLMYNAELIQRAASLTSESIGVSWLPMYHDMGLIGSVLQPIYTGFPCTLLSYAEFAQRPERWLQAITCRRATVSAAPNFAYELCTSQITLEQRSTLDLGSWRVALNGAEPIRAETLDRFAAAFAPYGFHRGAFFPCYGLAEATLLVSGGPVAAPPVLLHVDRPALQSGQVTVVPDSEPQATATLVGSGRVCPDQRLLIVDPETRQRSPAGRIGEIWVAGAGVARGYWNSPEATVETFQGYLSGTGREPFLRTGDLGFTLDRELFVTSRLKDLIVIRGRNFAPQDIEYVAERSHSSLRAGCGAAFPIDVDGDEALVVAYEVNRRDGSVNIEEVAIAIRREVAEAYNLEVRAVVLLRTGTLPKTSSGKVQRGTCRDQYLRGALQAIGVSARARAQRARLGDGQTARTVLGELLNANQLERGSRLLTYLQQQVAETVGVPTAQVDVDQPFVALGLDSLRLLQLKQSVETDLGVALPLEGLMDHPTVTQLGAMVLIRLDEKSGAAKAQVLRLTDLEVDSRLAELVAEV